MCINSIEIVHFFCLSWLKINCNVDNFFCTVLSYLEYSYLVAVLFEAYYRRNASRSFMLN
jgi:hypothetical protein